MTWRDVVSRDRCAPATRPRSPPTWASTPGRSVRSATGHEPSCANGWPSSCHGKVDDERGHTRTLARRLAPLLVAMAMQGLILWVPVEKLFMSEIGFTPASVG